MILPNVGPISVAGMNYSQVASVFKSALAHVYKNFDVSVTLGRLHSIQIFVAGEARRPGSYTVSSLSTLVNAIFASGGPSSRGSMRDIQLKRGGKTICRFDLYQLLLHGDKSKDMQLEPGDVILIPPASRRVAIAGSVERPAIYELKNGATLGGILRLCDGLSPIAAAQEAIVDRVADGSALKVERIKLNRAGMSAELHNGDIVRLLTIVPRFEKAVTLRGNVANPGKFPWYPGMRLGDLIPDKESLLTRDYWDARNRLGGEGLPGFADLEKIDGVQARPVAGKPASSGKDAVQPAYREEQRNLHADSSLGAATSGDHVPPIRDFLPRNTVQPSAP
ncbi:MAG: SLBB domain-containing protein, partial [Bryobacteraceae bacterium]